MRSLVVAGVVLLAGCPPVAQPLPPTPPSGPTTGCPAAKDVFTASYVISEPNKGRTGWVMPLFDARVSTLTGVPEYAKLDPSAAVAAGVPTAPASVWLVQLGMPPCQAKLGSYYAAAIDTPTSPNLSYGIELDGCPAPPGNEEGEALALVSAMSPAQCRLETPKPVATRLGEMTPQKQWLRPNKETPIPPALASAIPDHDCPSPTCEKLWSIAQVNIDNIPAAWAGAVNWLAIGDPAMPCGWHAETFSGFFIPGEDGKAVKVEDGQDHPLALATVLADTGGPKVLVADGAGEYTAYDLSPGKATVGHHVTWLIADLKTYDVDDRIGPRCDDDTAKP